MEMSKKLILVVAGLSLGACSSTGEKGAYMSFEDMQKKVHEHEEQWESVQSKLDRLEALEVEVAALRAEKMALETAAKGMEHSEHEMPADGSEEVMMDESMSTEPMSTEPMMYEEPMLAQETESADGVMHEKPMVAEQNMSADGVMHEKPMVAEQSMSADGVMHEKPMVENKPNMAMDPMSNEPIPMTPMPIPDIEKTRYGVQVAAYLNHNAAENGWKILQNLEPQSFKGLDPLIHEAQVKGRTVHQVKVGPFFDKSFSIDFCMMLKEKGKDCFVTEYNGVAVTAQ